MTQAKCPICENAAIISPLIDERRDYCENVQCPRCGSYALANGDFLRDGLLGLDANQIKTYVDASAPSSQSPRHSFLEAVSKTAYRSKAKSDASEARAVISHALSKGPVKRILTLDDFTSILTYTSLPTPAEQADNLIRYFGDRLIGFGDTFSTQKGSDEIKNIGARLGSKLGFEWPDFYALIVALADQGLLSITWAQTTSGGKKNYTDLSLTLSGWNRYEELDRKIRSKTAFIAMKFCASDGENYYFQNELLPKHLVTAVKQAGFVLSNPLAEKPEAGNIHARLELEIKNSRFVVAELSHSNNGAYWEAGFAKGLGKPVIYMYNKKIGKRDAPHFDVGSDQIVFWEEEHPEEAAKLLKAVIRNTLFGEANQNDDAAL
ncbi:hypothetical protein [Methylosinus sp. KRF6]|uniref:hypothetical protein n=1 Tax=Methylosinus sp. KRF6 TaxID=2846853 RepID=UPI001C0CFB6C|nr:hypothetical protein [Methylosinus sp. KRF6]MBU3887123.1 hypothetical protein [Methylosinus sp. KRF6]